MIECSHHAPRDDRGAGGSPAFVQASRLYHGKITASTHEWSHAAAVEKNVHSRELPSRNSPAAKHHAEHHDYTLTIFFSGRYRLRVGGIVVVPSSVRFCNAPIGSRLSGHRMTISLNPTTSRPRKRLSFSRQPNVPSSNWQRCWLGTRMPGSFWLGPGMRFISSSSVHRPGTPRRHGRSNNG